MSAIIAAPQSVWRFVKATWAETQRVSWPTRAQTIRLTTVVVVVCIVLGGALAALDYGLSYVLGILIK